MEQNTEEKRVSMPVRLPEGLARRFRAALALDGMKAQSFFEKAAREFTEKRIPE